MHWCWQLSQYKTQYMFWCVSVAVCRFSIHLMFQLWQYYTLHIPAKSLVTRENRQTTRRMSIIVPRHEKYVFGYMQTAKNQISLRIRAAWPVPSLTANLDYFILQNIWVESNGPDDTLPMNRMILICPFCTYSKTRFGLTRPTVCSHCHFCHHENMPP